MSGSGYDSSDFQFKLSRRIATLNLDLAEARLRIAHAALKKEHRLAALVEAEEYILTALERVPHLLATDLESIVVRLNRMYADLDKLRESTG